MAHHPGPAGFPPDVTHVSSHALSPSTALLVGGLAGCLAAAAGPVPGLSAQTFRAAVDLIAVDVQVTDRSGRPVLNLGPTDFQVTLDGRRRQVVSATFTEYDVAAVVESGGEPAMPGTSALLAAPDAPGRTFIIAVDTPSFRSLDVRVATLAGERFTRRLNARDKVGLVVLPDGPRLPPTDSHATIRQALGKVVGRKATVGHLEMGVEEVVDITAAMSSQSQLASRQTVGRIVASEDSGLGDAADSMTCSGGVTACTEQAMNEAVNLAMSLEQDVLQSLAGLDTLLRELQSTEGRKSVLLLSGGMPVSDRSGGRPTLEDEVKRLGEQATYANATINAIYFDPSVNEAFGVGARRRGGLSGRARGIYTRALAEFSEPSGGMLLISSTGAGESEVDRIASRIASYYVLGVVPEARDRDGRPHRLQVRGPRGLSIANRQLVVVPKGGQ